MPDAYACQADVIAMAKLLLSTCCEKLRHPASKRSESPRCQGCLALKNVTVQDNFIHDAQDGRRLLQAQLTADPQATELKNVVDVTVQFNSSSADTTGPIIAEVRSITGSSGSLQVPIAWLLPSMCGGIGLPACCHKAQLCEAAAAVLFAQFVLQATSRVVSEPQRVAW